VTPVPAPEGSPQLARRLVLAVALGTLLGGLLLAVGVRFVRVDGGSMIPTLRPGDVVVVVVLPGVTRSIEAGDVIVARAPGLAGRRRDQLIKRVARRLMSPEGPAFVLRGDDPDVSRDSRSFGPIPAEQVVGRAWLVLPHEAPWRVGRIENHPSEPEPATGSGPNPAGR
jgi:nickel-type superoxide dismutase maturation protease